MDPVDDSVLKDVVDWVKAGVNTGATFLSSWLFLRDCNISVIPVIPKRPILRFRFASSFFKPCFRSLPKPPLFSEGNDTVSRINSLLTSAQMGLLSCRIGSSVALVQHLAKKKLPMTEILSVARHACWLRPVSSSIERR